MLNQKKLFQLDPDVHYLNGAYMSPMLKKTEEIGIEAIKRKRNPFAIKVDDFFSEAEKLRLNFTKLVSAKKSSQIAIIPSVSYGIKTAVSNIPLTEKTTAITVSEEFPSDFYTIEEWCKTYSKKLEIISAPIERKDRAKNWSNKIVAAINNQTAVVILSSIHWTDGSKFNLKAIGNRCEEVGAYFIVDGTQSVGALPINVQEFKIDALVCAAYKWLLGPYSIGLAYYSEKFNDGKPLEETWINKSNGSNFAELTNYVGDYKPDAARYNMGESAQFFNAPMLNSSLEQLLDWQIESIQEYCHTLSKPLIQFLKENGFWVEDEEYRAKHLFGFILPARINKQDLLNTLLEKKTYVSVRGEAIRVSINVYNTEDDINALIDVLKTYK